MTCATHRTSELRQRGYRMTSQRREILNILLEDGGHLSPTEVYGRARQRLPGLTETTVYRTMEFLTDNGMVQPSLNGDRHLVYEISGHEHHHLVCNSCGRDMQVDHTLVHNLYHQLEDLSGYQLTSSHLTFFGLCPTCQTLLQKG